MAKAPQYRRFNTLLIANRGEIACRVIRSARAMGLRTVAVYSEADRDALHVSMADDAVLLGPARARDSYLNIEKAIAAARQSGAEGIHPGYGFLSENAEFAQACADAGLVFVGPTAAMMTAMGSKSGSKALMEKAGVPLVPGYHGEAQDDAILQGAADKIGYPVLVKASAGGGGRGMRVVRTAAELAPAIVHFGYGTLARDKAHVATRLDAKVVVSLRGYDINYFGLDDPRCYDALWESVDMLHVVSEDIWRRACRRA